MSRGRSIPRIRGFSVVVPAGVHVEPYDAWLLARAFAGAKPNLAAFLYSAGLARQDSERVASLVEAFSDVGAEWLASREDLAARRRPGRDEEISSREAALRLGVTPQRVGQLEHQGKLSGRLVGGRLLVTRASVEALRAARLAS
jgi:hypothetical protein